MPGKVVFTYFNIRGRGELPRLTLHAAGVNFEDNRIDSKEWLALKENTPTKTLPYLQVGKIESGQSLAIARYIAREHDLAGGNNEEMLYVDQIVDTCLDLQNEMIKVHFENDKERKTDLSKKLNEEILPGKMTVLTGLMDAHGKDGFFVTNKLTLADLAVYNVFENMINANPKLFEKHAKLAEHRRKIGNLPKIKAYIEKRPKTEI